MGELADRYQKIGDEAARGVTGLCSGCGEESWRVGTDVQLIEAVRDSVGRFGEDYLIRVYLPPEVADSAGSGPVTSWAAASSLAGRYASKEAVIKVLRPVQTGVRWNQIEVVREPGGWCTLALHHDAHRLAERSGLSRWALSFAHDGNVAVATVLAMHSCGH